MLFYYGVIFLGIGLLLGITSVVPLAFILTILLWCVPIAFFFYGPRARSIIICCLIFFIGIGYGSFYTKHHQPDQFLKNNVGKKIELQGTILSEPLQKEKSTQIVVTTDHGKVLLFANSFPHFSYGDEVAFKAKLKVPEAFETTPGRTFNYPGYLSKDNIFFTETYPVITKLSSHNGNFLKEKLYDLKNSLTKGMEKIIPFPESGLLEGITLAGKRALPQAINDDFKKAGVSHIVVLSGYNVTIVALLIMWALSRFGRVISFSAGTVGIFAFCILSGGTSTIIRAGIMSFLFLFSKFARRDADPNRLLFIAGGLMIVQNPFILLYDTSFHLSFLATFGLINVSSLVHRRLGIIPDGWTLKEIMATSIGVEIFLLPYLCYSMGNVSTIALISNIMLLTFIPSTMLIGMIGSLLTFLSLRLAYIPAFLSFVLLRYELGLVKFLASFPFSLVKTAVPFMVPAVFYLISIIFFLMRQHELRSQANSDSQRMLQHTSFSLLADSPAYMNAPTYPVPK